MATLQLSYAGSDAVLAPYGLPIRANRLLAQVGADLAWSFTRSRGWLAGLGLNLGLALLYLLVAPLTGEPHRDWAILVGSYFAVFILADVTTTNALGGDVDRVRLSLLRGVPLSRILLTKNLTLLLVVGLPTLVATTLITLHSESADRLALTLPGVLLPILTWLGVGNLVSVLLPVAGVPLRRRWRERRDLRRTGRWALALLLPYALCSAVDPITELPILALRALRSAWHGGLGTAGLTLLIMGMIFWASATASALVLARVRKVRFDDLG